MPLDFCDGEFAIGGIVSMSPLHGFKGIDMDCVSKCKSKMPAIG